MLKHFLYFVVKPGLGPSPYLNDRGQDSFQDLRQLGSVDGEDGALTGLGFKSSGLFQSKIVEPILLDCNIS